MMSDDDLILYHYRELEPAERARVSAALGEQPEVARRLHALVARLDAVAALRHVFEDGREGAQHARQLWFAGAFGRQRIDAVLPDDGFDQARTFFG